MSVQSSDELQPISNTKFPDKPEIIQTKFYDYNIRYLNAKTGKKFLVTDLLDQYAKIIISSVLSLRIICVFKRLKILSMF